MSSDCNLQHLTDLRKDDIGSLNLKESDMQQFNKLLNSIEVDQVDTNNIEYLPRDTWSVYRLYPTGASSFLGRSGRR